jgi:SAM-dependent methyltransferase
MPTPTWDERYQQGIAPWDTGRPDPALVIAVEVDALPRGTLLEVGCGTGTNARWLASQGYVVTGIDLSPTAIEAATSYEEGGGDVPRFAVAGFLADDVRGGPFGAVWDRGCFHTQDTPEERDRFARRVADHLDDGGIWLSVIGSTDGPPRDTGPPRRSALDVVAAVEPYFEILELEATKMDTKLHEAPRAWVLLARKRES